MRWISGEDMSNLNREDMTVTRVWIDTDISERLFFLMINGVQDVDGSSSKIFFMI